MNIYDVLKDPKLRKRYDDVLETGLPNWRSASFYFRRARKFTPLELSVSISIIVAIGHYFLLWAQHFEKKLTVEDKLSDVKKKLEKKQKKRNYKGSDLDDFDSELQSYYDTMKSPELRDTLPYRFVCWSVRQVIGLPSLIKEKMSKRKNEVEEDVVNGTDETTATQNGRRRNKKENNNMEHLKLNPEGIVKSNIKVSLCLVVDISGKYT